MPAAIASTSAASTPSRSVMTSASNMASLLPLARTHECIRGECGLPGLAHTRRAEPERRFVQRIELALARTSHVHDVEVTQDPQLVRGAGQRRAERLRQL